MAKGFKELKQAAKRDVNEGAIVAALELVGALVQRSSQAGWPDLLVLYRGNIYLMEVKSERGNLTRAQAEWFDRWERAGGRIYVVRSEVEALNVIGVVIVERKEDGTYTSG